MRNVYVCVCLPARAMHIYLMHPLNLARGRPSVCGAFGLYGHGRPSREISRQTSLIPQTVFAQWQHSSFQFPSSATLHVVVVGGGVGIELSVETFFRKKEIGGKSEENNELFREAWRRGGLEETGEWEI